MTRFDWKSVLKTAAPAVATALGGPLAGLAVKTIGDKLLGNPNASEADVEAAIAAMSPADMVKLREIDADFKKHMTDAGIQLEEIAAGDRDSARQREIALKDLTPSILAYAVTLGFFGILGYLIRFGLPAQNGDALLIMLGSLGTAWTGIVAYYYGSSAGSRAKTEIIAKADAIK